MKIKKTCRAITITIIIIAISIGLYVPVAYAENNMKTTMVSNIRSTTENNEKEEENTEKVEQIVEKQEEKKELAPQKGYVKVVSGLTLRKTASSDGKMIIKLKPGDIVTILSSKDSWYKVKTSSNKTGYVPKKYIGTKSNEEYNLLATYTTYSYSSPSGRNHNMQRAGDKIKKITLKSGDTFNWFDVVGPCGKEQGYKVANIIVAGEVEPGYGGGVCQVATTLYGCSKKLKMKTIERHDHSSGVSYLNNDGYEAAVAYGLKNLRFKNTTDKNIIFDIYVKSGRVTVAAYQVL